MEDKLRVCDCSHCNLFKNLPVDVKLYYPLKREDVPNSEFIIIDCKECSKPMVVYGEHLTELTREAYGRILYRCKSLFGSTIKIGNKHKDVEDHWKLHILSVI